MLFQHYYFRIVDLILFIKVFNTEQHVLQASRLYPDSFKKIVIIIIVKKMTIVDIEAILLININNN